MQNWIHVCRSGLAQMAMVTLVLLTIANPIWANDPVASDAIRTLRALNAATTAGLDKTEYQRRMIDTKVLIAEYLETPETGDTEIRVIIGRTMRFYELAGQAWGDQIVGARQGMPGSIKVEVFQRLLEETSKASGPGCMVLREKVSYGLKTSQMPTNAFAGSGMVPPFYGSGLVEAIWGCASDEVKAASALARQGATR